LSEFIVHATPGSPFSRSVMATLEEKGARWRLAALKPGTSKQEPHLSRHPFGRIPVLEHDDFMVYETQAILRYLDRILAEPSLTPDDPKAAARMDQVMNINDWYLFQGCGNIITFQRIIRPTLFGQPTDEAAVREAMPRAGRVWRTVPSAGQSALVRGCCRQPCRSDGRAAARFLRENAGVARTHR
jgi:glutathione S-transferase